MLLDWWIEFCNIVLPERLLKKRCARGWVDGWGVDVCTCPSACIMYCFWYSITSPFLLQAVAILKRTKGKVSLVVARKQGLPGSPPASDKAPSASVSPRRDTGSPRVHKKGPPVAKKPVRESTSDAKKPTSPRKAESPRTTEKPLEILPNGSALSAHAPTGNGPTGSPLVSRREPVQTQAFEPVVQIVQQSPREAARKFRTPFFSIDCFKAVYRNILLARWLLRIYDCPLIVCLIIFCLIFFSAQLFHRP